MAARPTLINPLLQALGWDPADPSLVALEYRAGVGWADYALKGPGNRSAAVIEAKRLGTFVENHLDQAVGYCIQEGIAYAGVTDGNHWQLYRTFDPRPLAEKIVLDVRIDNTSAHKLALQLLLLWQPNLASGQPVVANQPVLDPALAPLPIAPVDPTPTDATEESGAKPDSGETESFRWLPLPEYNPPIGSKAPIAIKFPDDAEFAIGSWKQLPKVVADWLYAKQLLTLETLPIVSGHKGFAANDEPAMRNGQPMRTYDRIGRGDIFINVHLSAVAARGNARKMLEHCAVDPADVRVRVD